MILRFIDDHGADVAYEQHYATDNSTIPRIGERVSLPDDTDDLYDVISIIYVYTVEGLSKVEILIRNENY